MSRAVGAPSPMLPGIIGEQHNHAAGIEAVLDAAFGPGRFAKVSERVREAARHNLDCSVTALDEGRVVGCCRLYDIAIGDRPALFLGPLAVHPLVQAGGLGVALVTHALALAPSVLPVLVVGQARFFKRFGFEQVPDGRVIMPGPTEARRLQWLRASPDVAGAVSGPRAAN